MQEYNTIKKNFETCGMLLIDKKQVKYLIETIEQHQNEIQLLQSRIDKVVQESAVIWINKTLKGE
jgi:prefoldin subunit 5